ncbi:thiamine pyrophosphate-binding protein [Pallidibacillus pasinlerensis]|uniref:Thiamine pyrophosphate-binding protein n=1 Tax=Pallidibacillus pasinlerensis TaxID=2703818 RepID=A0ABX0ABL7_9BACI|nr:thiamine pyrophosphate-binding protein [Pallidibacillus pasinlerensis]NCU18457.1 thiamine pyrophosphate-binding protein [Pallidibacillus pasinlerensis]
MNKSRKQGTSAQAIVECMKREGITKVFCVPGESYLPLLDALYDEDSIELISCRHEGGAAFMAEGYAKASLKPGVVMATRGVGGNNLGIGIHTAYQDSTPLVVFLGQVSTKFRGREGFQEIDLDEYFKHIAKWTVEIHDPERTVELVTRAFRIAQSGRPGPVVVSLPEDVLPEKINIQFGPHINIPKPAPSKNEITQFVTLLSQAKKPLIIAGGGVKQAEAEDLLLSFAEKNNLPVLASFRRHDVFPNHHPQYVGHLGLGTPKDILDTVRQSDLIIALGTRLSEVTTQDYSIIPIEKKLIHIDIDFETIGKVFPPELGIVADLKEALRLLIHFEFTPSWGKWVKTRRTAYENSSKLDVNIASDLNRHIISILQEKLPKNVLLTNDAGNFAGWLHRYYRFREKHTYIGPTSGAMGYGMPAALGAKLAYPDKTVVSLSGDGGFMMTIQEIETAVRYKIPIIALVFNNQMYGTIRMHQEIHYPERVIGTDLGPVSFKDLAIHMGANGYVVETPEQFSKALKLALQGDKISVIEILTNPEQISVTSTIEQISNK